MGVLKVYVWPEYQPDYTNGLAVAIAETEELARDQVTEVDPIAARCRDTWGPVEVHELKPQAHAVWGGS